MKQFLFSLLLIAAATKVFAQEAGDTLFNAFYLQSTPAGISISFTVRGGIQCTGLSIERSGDMSNFGQVYEYPGVCGNPGADETYTYLDANPLRNQINYYRLNIGGFGLTSSTKSVFHYVVAQGEILVAPNPCSNCLVRFPNEKKENCKVRVTDTAGREIIGFTTSATEFLLTQGDGILMVTIEYPDNEQRQTILIRQ